MDNKRLMTSDAITVGPLTTLEQAARTMRERDVGSLPVVRDGKLVGIVTDRDIVVRGVAEGRDGMFSRVSDVMTDNPLCCVATSDVEQAAKTMGEAKVRRLPVVDEDGTLVGMISLADLVRHKEGSVGYVLGEVTEPNAIKPKMDLVS